MGLYINPKNMSKEDWLRQHGQVILDEKRGISLPPPSHIEGDNVAVCLVDNGGFTAAGVAYSADELASFAHPDDRRPKVWLWVPISEIEKLIPGFREAFE